MSRSELRGCSRLAGWRDASGHDPCVDHGVVEDPVIAEKAVPANVIFPHRGSSGPVPGPPAHAWYPPAPGHSWVTIRPSPKPWLRYPIRAAAGESGTRSSRCYRQRSARCCAAPGPSPRSRNGSRTFPARSRASLALTEVTPAGATLWRLLVAVDVTGTAGRRRLVAPHAPWSKLGPSWQAPGRYR